MPAPFGAVSEKPVCVTYLCSTGASSGKVKLTASALLHICSFIFLQFFASLLENYREYIDHDPAAEQPFDSTAFLLKRTKNTKRPAEPMVRPQN